MKKIIVALSLLAVTGTAMAQHYHGHGFRHHGHYRGPGVGWWVAPVVVGAIGYELGRQQIIAGMAKWHTRQPQKLLRATSCGFNSLLRHHLVAVK